MRLVSVSVNTRGTFQQLCNAFLLNCSSQSNYQSTQGAQIFLRSNTSQLWDNLCLQRFCYNSGPDVTDVLIIIATICCSPLSDRTLERNLIWSKLWLFTRGALSYSALDLQQSEALETLGVVAVTSKIFSLWPPPTASTARSLVLVLVLVLCHRPPPPVLHAARRASLVQSYFSDGTRCAAFS